MGHLRIRANEFWYKQTDRRLKEEFINGMNDVDTIAIIRELT